MPEQLPTPETAPTPLKPDSPVAQLRDRRLAPEGIVPKQAQSYVVAGLALLILMAVMFSKNRPRPAVKDTLSAPAPVSTDVNQRQIQELEQDLSAQQRQAEAQKASPVAPAGTATTMPSSQTGITSPAMQVPPPVDTQPTEAPRDPIADAEKALAFKARFASNLVGLNESAAHASTAVDAASASDATPFTNLSQAPAANPSATNSRVPEINVNAAHGKPFVVFEGTTVDTVLVNRLDGEFSGPVKVMVTNPVYSQDRQHLLIPEGTFILGEVQKVGTFGQKRVAVAFHRMLMPDGYSVDLDQFHGLDQAGATGIKDKINNHYVEIFGASIALGVIAGAAEATNSNQGYNQSGSEAYKAGIASSFSQSGSNALDRFINIPPTITIREGHRIKVYIMQDLLLPAYENHDMPRTF